QPQHCSPTGSLRELLQHSFCTSCFVELITSSVPQHGTTFLRTRPCWPDPCTHQNLLQPIAVSPPVVAVPVSPLMARENTSLAFRYSIRFDPLQTTGSPRMLCSHLDVQKILELPLFANL